MKPGVRFERVWRRFGAVRLDPLAQHPRGAIAAGLAMVAALVPLLNIWRGASGPLGQSIPLFFLIPVLFAAVVGGRGAGVVVSCAAIAVWDWFFIPPLYTVTIASPRDVLALVVFLGVALLVGQLSTAVGRRAREALRRAYSSEALYDLSMALIARTDLADVLRALCERLQDAFHLQACAVLLQDEKGRWHTAAQAGRLPSDLRVEESRSLGSTAARVLERNEECRLGRVQRGQGHSERVHLPHAGEERARLIPLKVAARPVGVLEVMPREAEKPDAEREQLLRTFANGAAIALEQARLAEEERAATLARESDRLKSALLSSISHDLRTPLAGIKAAASSLQQQDIEWSAEDRRAFIMDINDEADRLTRLVSNLLDLSRIEAGALKPEKEWEDAGELVTRTVNRLRPRMPAHVLTVDLPEMVPPIRLDAVQIEQVLTNLLENADKYAPRGTEITVSLRAVAASESRRWLRIEVQDRGPGIPVAEQSRIFDTFYRISGPGNRASGTGLGLAIVKGLVEAHGGHVEVDSAPGEGSTFSVFLPLEAAAAVHAKDSTSLRGARGEQVVS